jgi:beta-N-acetylhexosaminidase
VCTPRAVRTRRRALAVVAAAAVLAAVVSVIVLSLRGAAHSPTASSKHTSANTTRLSRHARSVAVHPARRRNSEPTSARSLAQNLGQMIVARFQGPQPPQSFLARIRAGEIGGVILFSDNLSGGVGAARALTVELQRAARERHQPPLLIMTDQEGGEVKRLPGPPTLSPAAMTSSAVAFAQGQATGRLLLSVGINVDLAPVADVERVAGSFLGTRSFGADPVTVAQRACAFARGLASQHVAYTLKHFPGLGRASASTDVGSVTIDASANALRTDYQAYQACGASPLALVMISSAIYPALSDSLPAVMSPAIYHRELPIATDKAQDVTVSDDLEAPAIANQSEPARHAINAGLDLLMYAQTPGASAQAYATLLKEAKAGALNTSRIDDAGHAIASLKGLLAP